MDLGGRADLTQDVSRPWSERKEGILLSVRVTPRASRTALGGVTVGADGQPLLAIRLAAPPVDGAANQALVAFLADRLSVRQRDITIVAGQSGRNKTIRIAGDPAAIASRLAEQLDAHG